MYKDKYISIAHHLSTYRWCTAKYNTLDICKVGLKEGSDSIFLTKKTAPSMLLAPSILSKNF